MREIPSARTTTYEEKSEVRIIQYEDEFSSYRIYEHIF